MLAVTAQNAGVDGVFGTADDVPASLNPLRQGIQVSVDLSIDNACNNLNDRVREFASMHPGGANFLLADGSVRFISESVPLRVYQALSTIQGDEVIPGDF